MRVVPRSSPPPLLCCCLALFLSFMLSVVPVAARNLDDNEITAQFFGVSEFQRLGGVVALKKLGENSACLVAGAATALGVEQNNSTLKGRVYVYRDDSVGTAFGDRNTLIKYSRDYDGFGMSISASDNCERVVVGGFVPFGQFINPFKRPVSESLAEWVQVGHVFRYNKVASRYDYLQLLKPEHATAPSGASMRSAGVAMNNDGSTVALSLQMKHHPGEAFVWQWDPMKQNYVSMSTTPLTAENPTNKDDFGKYMQFHDQWLFASAPQSDELGPNVGSVSRFGYQHSDGVCPSYQFEQTILPVPPSPNGEAPANCLFGARFDVHDEGLLVVGAYGDKNESGSVFTFAVDGDGFHQQIHKLTEPDLLDKDRYGWALSLMGSDVLVVGAYYKTFPELVDPMVTKRQGAVYVYDRDAAGIGWTHREMLTLDDLKRKEFGSDVACCLTVESSRCAFGAYYDSVYDETTGAKLIHHSGSVSIVDLPP